MFQATISLFFLTSTFVGGLAILELQGMLVWGVWGLILSLNSFRRLVLRIPSEGNGRLVLRIPGSWDLWLGHGSMSWAITLWVTLIYLSENRGRFEAIDCFLTNRSQLSHFFCIIPSGLGLESFSKELNEVGIFWNPISIKINNRNASGEMPNCQLLLASTRSFI